MITRRRALQGAAALAAGGIAAAPKRTRILLRSSWWVSRSVLAMAFASQPHFLAKSGATARPM